MQPLELIVSQSLQAVFNLALEEHLFNTKRNVLLFYRNADAVIVGKHQNIWKEVNIPFCEQENIAIVRRLSGGGTVFHDHGNLNFSYIRSKTQDLVHFRAHIEPISNALVALGVNNHITERNDIFIGTHKISGNAEHVNQSKGRILHHGTLLYRSRLDRLHAAIHSSVDAVRSHAVDSVRSTVTSISDHLDLGETEDFMHSLLAQLNSMLALSTVQELQPEDLDPVRQLVEDKYGRWDWNFGHSPQFEYHSPLGILTVRRGVVIDIHSELLEQDAQQAILGCRFNDAHMKKQLPASLHPYLPKLLP